MRIIFAMFAVLMLAGACASDNSSSMARNDPAGQIHGHGMITGANILVPGTTTTIH